MPVRSLTSEAGIGSRSHDLVRGRILGFEDVTLSYWFKGGQKISIEP